MKIEEKINFKRLSSVVKKNSIGLISIIFLITLLGYFYSYNMVTPKYKSTSTILLASNNLNNTTDSLTQTEITLNKSLISTYGKILKSNNVLEKVKNNLDLEISTEELYENIQIAELDDTQILQIDVINESAVQAQRIAEELNNVFIEEIKQIYKIDNINVVDRASLAQEPFNINHVKDVCIFFGMGIIVSTLLVSIIFIFDTTIKIEQDIEEYSGLKVMGTIPIYKGKENEELIVQNDSKSVISEALKTIRTNLSFTQSNNIASSILFTSCNSGEGKSWAASNMAVAYAQSNKNVIIIDADMRKGRQHNIFKVLNIMGLSDCLTEIKSNPKFENFKTLERYIKETNIPKVHIMTIGTLPPNPSELLLGNEMKQLIDMLKSVYDVIIVDGTPCNLVSDCIPVSRIVDTTIVVTESKKTKIEDLNNLVKTIKNASGKIEGAILNKKEIQNKEYNKGYYYGYGQTENSSKIEIESCTVKELISNRKKHTQNEEVIVEEQKENESLTELIQKIESIEHKLSEIPEMNLDKYTKMINELTETYTNEIDKNKLAQEIKENVIRNELIKKIDENNIEVRNMLMQELKQLSYENEKEEIINKIADIEKTIHNEALEEKMNQMINEMKEEQNEKIQQLDNNKVLNDIAMEIQKLNEKYEQINDTENDITNESIEEKMKQIINEMKEEQDKKIQQLDNKEFLENILEEVRRIKIEQNEKIEQLENGQDITNIQEAIQEIKQEQAAQLDSNKLLNSIALEIQKLNEKYEQISDKENDITNETIEEKMNQMINTIKEEQDIKIQQLDNTEFLQNILEEIRKVKVEQNEKIDKLDNEQAIKTMQQEIEEKMAQMIHEVKEENEKKIEEISNDNQFNEIIEELKQINKKYTQLTEEIAKNKVTSKINDNIEQINVKKQERKKTSNKIIELNEVKGKLNKQEELIVEYGEEILYEDLLDFAIEIYEINPNKTEAIM